MQKWRHAGSDKRVRGRAGQAQRRRRLARTDGLCERCLEHDRVTVAAEVDHIKPLAQGGSDDDDNTRNLCVPCHDIVTAEQFGIDRTKGLGGCDINGMPLDPAHAWNRRR